MNMFPRAYPGIVLLGALLIAALQASVARAGAVYVYLIIDPATTAGAGIAPVSSGGANMVVTSTRSGPGTWHLYAVDDTTGSAGIRSYLVKLNGTVSSINNRSPRTDWDIVTQDGPFTAGLNAPRTALNSGQDPSNSVQIGGLGISAGNFIAKLPTADPTAFVSTTSGQWGNYPDFTSFNISSGQRNALFLAEGLYTGAPPTVDVTTPIGSGGTAINFWKPGFPNNGSEPVSAAGSATGQTLIAGMPVFAPIEVFDRTINNVNANSPGSVVQKFFYGQDVSGPVTWSNFIFDSFVPDPGAAGTGPAIAPTFDLSSGTFNWTTTGSPRGVYTWRATATVPAMPGYSPVYSDTGALQIHITQVPEPATMSLLGLVLYAVFGSSRCRA